MAEVEQIKDEDLLKFSPQRQHQPAEVKNVQGVMAEGPTVAEVQSAQFQNLDAAPAQPSEREKKLDLLMGISLPVSVELGRTNLEIRSILSLKRGSIIEFHNVASEPVDIVVNGKKMAEGEVVVIDKHFAVRVTNLVETAERIKGLGK